MGDIKKISVFEWVWVLLLFFNVITIASLMIDAGVHWGHYINLLGCVVFGTYIEEILNK